MEEKEKVEINFDNIPEYNYRFYENILPKQNEVVMVLNICFYILLIMGIT